MARRKWRARQIGATLLGAAALALGVKADDEGLLRLLNGSVLHGEMSSLSPANGLVWNHLYAAEALGFPFSSLVSIRFPRRQPRTEERRSEKPKATKVERSQCRFRFANGDEVYGKIVEMDDSFLKMETEFGGSLRASRKQVQSIAFLQNGYRVLYEGPNGMDEWVRSKSPNGWSYRDGALNVTNRGVIGRDMNLKNSARLAFDLRWEGNFQLTITMHAETLDRHDYRRGAYLFALTPSYASFRRVQPGAGTMTLGDVQFPHLANQTKSRFDLRSHRDKASFALLANGEVIASWKDARGFVAQGSGVSFSASAHQSALSLSQILVTEWDGHLESEWKAAGKPSSDGLLLVNRDQPAGQVRGIRDGRLRFGLRNRLEVNIPLERVRQIYFHRPEEPEDKAPADKEIRVTLFGGGSLSFALSEWTKKAVRGVSSTFGPVEFQPDSIRLAAFNLNHPLRRPAAAQENPEDIWNFETEE